MNGLNSRLIIKIHNRSRARRAAPFITLSIFLVTISIPEVSAGNVTPPPAVAILDTAIDSSLPIFKNRISNEVCILDWPVCPNGLTFMEGVGAATMPMRFLTANNFDHGTLVTSVFIANNIEANIIFIRIISSRGDGSRLPTNESTLYKALNWVVKNAEKWNIQAVAMSQGSHDLGYVTTNYCPSSPSTVVEILKLEELGIPTFFPSGNGEDKSRIDWPSCIPEAIAIGAVDLNNSIESYSNYDLNLIDFYANGRALAFGPGGVKQTVSGTSIAVQIATAIYLRVKATKSNLDYRQLMFYLKSSSRLVYDNNLRYGKKIEFMPDKSLFSEVTSETIVKLVRTNKFHRGD